MAASLELAITAIRSGRKEEGRQLLNLLIQQNPNNEHAWLWMSSVVNTDEQRARCLYHVLAINPDNEIARRGLKILGIVVTDSRPVKIPRDSQPIKIPKPTPPAQPGFPSSDQLESRPVAVPERRPFRIDPQAIVAELPFTPVKDPFSGEPQPQAASPSGPSRPEVETKPLEEPEPSAPVPVAGEPQPASPEPSPAPVPPAPGPENRPDAFPAAPAQPAQNRPPSEPTPPVVPNNAGFAAAGGWTPAQSQYPAPPVAGPGPVNDTRPSQPFPVIPANPPQNPQPPAGPGYPNPSYPPGVHSNMTMGMPTQYVPSQPPSQPVPVAHSSGTIPMPQYPQYPPPMPPAPAIHSNSTMAMPLGYDPFAGFAAPPGKGPQNAARPRANKNGKSQPADEPEDEVNILAVIIFGSLSVTALGGLGMLILLMFTTG